MGERLFEAITKWDAAWYMSIVQYGYTPNGELGATFSNVVFFPLFPFLVRAFSYFLPGAFFTTNNIIIVGTLVSNGLFIIASVIFYLFIKRMKNDEALAKRAVWYLIIFPTSFYFSLFYTESAYFLFVIASFWMAQQDKWKWAGFLGGLAALARSPGVLIVIPLIWMYGQSREWSIYKMDWNFLWLGLIPTGTASLFLTQYWVTGNILGPVVVQQAWGRNAIPIWESLLLELPTTMANYHLITLNKIVLISFLLLGFIILFRESFVLGLYTILQLIPQLATGSFDSSFRYCVVLFPVFILLAIWGKNQKIHDAIVYLFLIFQTILVASFGQGYWIV